jgi:hypothetical protein
MDSQRGDIKPWNCHEFLFRLCLEPENGTLKKPTVHPDWAAEQFGPTQAKKYRGLLDKYPGTTAPETRTIRSNTYSLYHFGNLKKWQPVSKSFNRS